MQSCKWLFVVSVWPVLEHYTTSTLVMQVVVFYDCVFRALADQFRFTVFFFSSFIGKHPHASPCKNHLCLMSSSEALLSKLLHSAGVISPLLYLILQI